MLFQGKDGELRLIDYGVDSASGSTRNYLEVLFCEMDLSIPAAPPRTDETLIMNRGKMDGTNEHFIESNDEPIYAPQPISFSCRLADIVDTRALTDWLSGATLIPNVIGGTTQIYSWDDSGVTMSATGFQIPSMRDSGKQLYRIEVLWDGTNDLGYLAEGVYFPPNQQVINESADGVILSVSGMIYGGTSRIDAFSTTGSGVTYWPFS